MQYLVRDGVRLAYEEAGAGAPPVLLVHGWAHDHTFLWPQFDYFRKGHRVVAVDLPGHGQSDKPDATYSIAGFADDLAWLIRESGVHRPVAVGHSMGGAVVLELAAIHPDTVSAVVLLDPPIFVPAGLHAALAPISAALQSPGYQEALRSFVASTSFLDTDDSERKAQIIERMSATPQHVLAGVWEAMLEFDAARAAAACQAPALCVLSSVPICDVSAFRAVLPSLMVGQTVGAGHYHQLEVPDQVNAMINRFLTIRCASAASALTAMAAASA
jgi:pimeloyl-ACP methyl ester carboxylesterase